MKIVITIRNLANKQLASSNSGLRPKIISHHRPLDRIIPSTSAHQKKDPQIFSKYRSPGDTNIFRRTLGNYRKSKCNSRWCMHERRARRRKASAASMPVILLITLDCARMSRWATSLPPPPRWQMCDECSDEARYYWYPQVRKSRVAVAGRINRRINRQGEPLGLEDLLFGPRGKGVSEVFIYSVCINLAGNKIYVCVHQDRLIHGFRRAV